MATKDVVWKKLWEIFVDEFLNHDDLIKVFKILKRKILFDLIITKRKSTRRNIF